jgi:hypothetical protein
MVWFALETVATDWNCLFRRFCPFVALEIIQNNVRKIKKYTWENGVYGGNGETTVIGKIYKHLSVFACYLKAKSRKYRLLCLVKL